MASVQRTINLGHADLAKTLCKILDFCSIKPLSANPTNSSNTLKQFVGNLPTNCLSVFNHFVKLALKGLGFRLLAELENRYESASSTRLEIREEHIDESLFRFPGNILFKEYSISFLMISRLIDLCFPSY